MSIHGTMLTTSALSVGYSSARREIRLFENLNLRLQAGEMVCFMGPNGIGKSSLLRTVAGLQQPLSGHVSVKGAPAETSKQISVVLTDRISALSLTVEELVTFGRYPYVGWNIALRAGDRKIIRDAVASVHLEPLLHRKLFELSDGQLQIAMIARALAQDTPIILLDEPTAHLDLNNRVEIMNLLRHLARRAGKAILLATHELDLALQTADRIWLAGKNKDIIEGFPEDLVLTGAFDRIFEFKGFDLKTGRVRHTPFRNLRVRLTGHGPEFLWTKNALERDGWEVTPGDAPVSVEIQSAAEGLHWIVRKDNKVFKVDSVEAFMKLL